MDGEITAIPSSTVEADGGEGGDARAQTPDSCRLVFDKAFPFYLAIGMDYDGFYRKDHTLAISYRRAYEIRRKQDNEDKWLQGAYVYEAISRVAPLLIPFNEHPKPLPYLDKPYPLFADNRDENAESKAVADKGLAYMQAQMIKFNQKFGKE